MWILALISAAYAEERIDLSAVPPDARLAIERQWPGAVLVRASRVGDGIEVAVTYGKRQLEIALDVNGGWTAYDEEVDAASLPAPVAAAVARYGAIIEVGKQTRVDGTASWEVEVAKGKKTRELRFDAQGIELPAEVDEADPDDDGERDKRASRADASVRIGLLDYGTVWYGSCWEDDLGIDCDSPGTIVLNCYAYP